MLDHFGLKVTDIPVLICRGELVLRNPTNAEAAACFRIKMLESTKARSTI